MPINRLIAALLFLSTASIFSYGQTGPSTMMDTVIRREMAERRIPGLQVAVVQHGKIVLLKSYGLATIQDSALVTDRSIFSINSCTKAFTGIAIMQLVEAGKLDIAAPVSRYLDGLPAAWQPVTVKQLLTHISGLPDILRRVLDQSTGSLAGAGTEEAAWAKVQTMPMEFPTGEQFSYNQTNYILLGKIIDKFSEKPFAQVFRERQFRVAGMTDTDFGDSRDVIPNKAQSYRYVTKIDGQTLREAKITNTYEEFPSFRRTASGINSTAIDIAKWVIALQQGKLLKTKTALKTLWTAGTYNNGSPTQWALGWVTKPRLAHHAVIATGGGRSAFFVYPDDDLAIIVLTNLAGAYPEEFIDELAGSFNPEIPKSDPITSLHIQLRKRGFDQALEVVSELRKQDLNFQPTETDLNDWAYRLMSRGQLKQALSIFKLNVTLFPESWNVYDSYGEVLLKNGQKEDAIIMYRKSIALNPTNENGKKIVEQLSK